MSKLIGVTTPHSTFESRISDISCEPVEAPLEEIAAAKAAGKCGDCYACCAGHHEQCKGTDFDWHNELNNEPRASVCSVFGCVVAASTDPMCSGMCHAHAVEDQERGIEQARELGENMTKYGTIDKPRVSLIIQCTANPDDHLTAYVTESKRDFAIVLTNSAGQKISTLLSRDAAIKLQNELNHFIINN